MWIGDSAKVGYTTSNCLINNAGIHPMVEVSQTKDLIGDTYYPIRIFFGEHGGGDDCVFSFSAPGISRIYDLTGHVFFWIRNKLFFSCK